MDVKKNACVVKSQIKKSKGKIIRGGRLGQVLSSFKSSFKSSFNFPLLSVHRKNLETTFRTIGLISW